MATNRERDQAIEHLLRQSAAVPAPSGPGPCLDAETLAAWAEGSLTPKALGAVEAHASECARCQAMVAVLMKQPLAVKAAEERRAWKWGLGWLVPLAAGVAAVGLWFAVPQQPTSPLNAPRPARPQQVEPKAVDAVAPPAGALAGRAEPVPPPLPQATARAASPAAAAERSKVANELAKADVLDERRRDQSAPAVRRAEEALRGGTSPSGAGVGGAVTPPAAALQQPAARPLPAAVSAGAAAPASAPASGAGVGGAAPPPAAPPPPARAAVSVAAPANAPVDAFSARARQETGTTRQIASPVPSVRWRLGAGGSVEVTSNSGATWQAQSSGVTVDLTGGSSPTASVCWLVGRAGTVLRTTDGGRSWLRVVFPQAVDLIAVQAVDALTATVTASDGRTFRTSDAGRTWQ